MSEHFRLELLAMVKSGSIPQKMKAMEYYRDHWPDHLPPFSPRTHAFHTVPWPPPGCGEVADGSAED